MAAMCFTFRILSLAVSQTIPDNAGREFIVCPIPIAASSYQLYQIHIASAKPTTKDIAVRLWNPLLIFPSSSKVDTSFIIQPNKRVVAEITNYVTVLPNQNNTAALVIKSDEDIIAYITIRKPDSIGSTVLLPTNTLGIRYRALTHAPTPSASDRAILVIAAAYDETEVTLIFKGDPSLSVTVSGTNYYYSDKLTITLSKKYENFVMFAAYDITGTTVEGTKPISVFCGNKALSLNNDGVEDLALEQLSPVTTWGVNHIIMSNSKVEGDILKILTGTDLTKLYVNDTLYTLTSMSDFILIPLLWDNSNYITINSSFPIQVAIFGFSSPNMDGIRSDVAMTIIQPIQNYVENYVFVTAASNLNFQHYLVVLSQKGFPSAISLDNSNLPGFVSWKLIKNEEKSIDYEGTVIQLIAEGCHKLSSVSNNIGGYVYGVKDRESYSVGLASVSKTTWNVNDPVVVSKYQKKTVDEIPFPDPLHEQTEQRLLKCYEICSRQEKCGVIGTIKLPNGYFCKFYELETKFGPFQKAVGYKLYVRNRNYS